MNYKVEFERLLEYSKQALSGVNIENREIGAVLGLSVLRDVIADYDDRISKGLLNDCSYSEDKVHHFQDGACIYCEAVE